MSNLVTSAAKIFAGKQVDKITQSIEPDDPYYEYYLQNGKQKRRKRPVPPGLTKQEEKVLKSVRSRAHCLDKGFNMCGLHFGWTFIIGLIPFAGDITDALLNYNLVVKKCKKLDGIPESLIQRMMFNNSVSIGLGLIPVVGDIGLAAWKTNWRNAELLEQYLRKVSQERANQAKAHPMYTSEHAQLGGLATSNTAPPIPPRH